MATRHYRLRIRAADDLSDALVLSSVPTDAAPYLTGEAPHGDGQSLDVATGQWDVGLYTVQAVDAELQELTAIAQDTFTDANDTAITSHVAEAPAETYVKSNFFTTDIQGNAFRTKGGAPSYVLLAGDGAAGVESAVELVVDFTRQAFSTLDSTYWAFYARASATGGVYQDGIGIKLGPIDANTVQVRAVRGAAGVLVEDTVLGTLALANAGGQCRFVLAFSGATVTYYRENFGGGTRTLIGAKTFGVSFENSGHRRWRFETQGNANQDVRIDLVEALVYTTYRLITRAIVDANGRQTLVHRRAYVEMSDDGGSSWGTVLIAGYVNSYRLLDALRWQFQIADSQRVEFTRRAFARYTDYLPAISCLIGGPIHGGWGPVPDRGAPVFEVVDADAGAHTVTLAFEQGFLPVEDGRYELGPPRGMGALALGRANRFAQTSWEGVYEPTGDQPVFSDLTVRVADLDGTLVDDFIPVVQFEEYAPYGPLLANAQSALIVSTVGTPWDASPPLVGAQYRLYAWRNVVGKDNPYHYEGHPVDLITALLSDAGIPWDSTLAAATKSALGPNLLITLRITDPPVLGDCLRLLCGLFGVGLRRGDDGEIEIVVVRVRNLTAPSNTYDLTDLRSPDTVIFELDESTIYNTIRIAQQEFRAWSDEFGTERPLDDVQSLTRTREVPLDSDGDGTPDSATEGPRELVFDLPGTISVTHAALQGGGYPFAGGVWSTEHSLAMEIFDRFGRGGVFGNVEVLDTVVERLGDELILDVAHLPNAGVRGGARILQVVQRTVQPEGLVLRLLDSGPNSQFNTSPTFTLAASGNKQVAVTVTNKAALDTARAWLRVQWHAGGSAPADGGALLATYSEGYLPADFLTPLVDAGARIWIRMQAFRNDQRPTAWSAWQDVNLTDLVAPSALGHAADPDDAGRTKFSWTVGETDVPLEVYQRPQGDPADEAVLVARLPAGSAEVWLSLTPAVSYTLGVRHAEDAPFHGVSTTTEMSFTVPGAVPTLPAPYGASAFCGLGSPETIFSWHSTIGLCIQGAVVPSAIEVEMAVETAVGSGIPGAYTLQQTVPTAVSGLTRWETSAPVDGKLRYLRARHVRPGATASAYTAVVSVMPGLLKACSIPTVSTVQLFQDPSGAVRATVMTRGGGSVKIAAAVDTDPDDSSVFPDAAAVRAETALDTDEAGVAVSGTLLAISDGETAYVSVLAYEEAAGAGAESIDLGKQRISFVAGGGFAGLTTTHVKDGWAASLNGAESVVLLDSEGEEAFSNLEDATPIETTFTVSYMVNSQSLAGTLMELTLWKNDGPASTNWTQVGVKTYSVGQKHNQIDSISFAAQLDANWDLKAHLHFLGVLGGSGSLLMLSEISSPAGVEYDALSGSFSGATVTGSPPAEGDTLYGTAGAWAAVAGNVSTTRKFWRQVGDGATAGAPDWDTVLAADVVPGDLQEGQYNLLGGLATDVVLGTRVTGDATQRYQLYASGKMEWGAGGVAAVDTNLYRSAADTLKTDDALIVAGLLTAQAGLTVSGGSFVYGSNPFDLVASTSDGADTNVLRLSGGGAFGSTRGAVLQLIGNERAGGAGIAGSVYLDTGDVTGAQLHFRTANGAGLVEALTLNADQTATFAASIAASQAILGTSLGVNALVQGSSNANTGLIYLSPVTGTQAAFGRLVNNSGDLFWGVDRSTGGALFSGGTAYAGFLGVLSNQPLQFGTNATIRLTIAATGAADFQGHAVAMGALTATTVKATSGFAVVLGNVAGELRLQGTSVSNINLLNTSDNWGSLSLGALTATNDGAALSLVRATAGGNTFVGFYDTTPTLKGFIQYVAANDEMAFGVAGSSGKMRLGATAIVPESAALLTLGTTALPWKNPSFGYDASNRLDVTISDAGLVTYTAVGASAKHLFADDVDVSSGKVYRVNTTQVVGAQGAAVADATDPASTMARLNDWLARARAHGLIAT